MPHNGSYGGDTGGGNQTGSEIVALLEALPAGSKLDALTGLDNLPFNNPLITVPDFNNTGTGWYEVFRIQGSIVGQFLTDFLIRIAGTANTETMRVTVSGNTNDNSDGSLAITSKVVRSTLSTPASVATRMRLVRDKTTPENIRVLLQVNTAALMAGTAVSLVSSPQPTETLGAFVDRSTTLDDVIFEEDMTEWLTDNTQQAVAGNMHIGGRPMTPLGWKAGLEALPLADRMSKRYINDYIAAAPADLTVNYSSEIGSTGDPADQGWTKEGYAAAYTMVENQYGYDRLLHVEDTVTNNTAGIYNALPATTGAEMWANGWRWEIDMRVDGGQPYHWLSADSTYGAGSGRWLFQQEINGADAQLIIGSTTYVFAGKATEFLHISVVCQANTDVASVYVDGAFVATLARTNYSSSDVNLRHSSASSVSVDEDFWILNSNFMVMTTAQASVTLTREQIEDGVHSVMPNVVNTPTVFLTKGTYTIGTSFEIVNGSDKTMTVQCETGGTMLFNGNPTIQIAPGRRAEFEMTSFPRGVIWAVTGSVETQVAQPNTLKLMVDATGNITFRHPDNTYTGGVTIARVAGQAAGAWTIIPDDDPGFVYGVGNTYITCHPIGSADRVVATPAFTVGEPEVHTYSSTLGARIDMPFTVELAWT